MADNPQQSRSAPMEGAHAYSRSATLQAANFESAIPLFVEAATLVPLGQLPGSPLLLADYGAAQGGNSLKPFRDAIAALRKRVGPDHPIVVAHNDVPSNDFSALFETLETHPDSYLHGEPNVFPSAVGRSFYEPLFPPKSVTLGWSAMAAHWLSSTPVNQIPDHYHYARSEAPEVRAAYMRQGAEDWRRFLTQRAQELRPGGRLVVVLIAETAEGDYGWAPLHRHVQAGLRALTAAGAIAFEEVTRMTLPVLARSRDALWEPFATYGRFAGLTMPHLEVYDGPDPIWDAFQLERDAAAYGRSWARWVRTTLAPSLATALAPDAGSARKTAFIEKLEADAAARFAQTPEPMPTYFARLMLAKDVDAAII